ncbi:MAG: rare lipoprotein A [Phenylobacterium sp.]|jgi:rare lipoprotein A
MLLLRSFFIVLMLILVQSLISGCAQSSRYTMKSDKAPLRPPTSLELINPTPVHLPLYPPALRPYKVLGKHYTPLKSAQNYQAQGIASWYGRKFHGHLTSNGETYDMFAMSAAHTTLPIPSFARVTNLDNNKSVIVRVNDRGPFHDKRLVDLSYTAAWALGMLAKGTARVKLEAITVSPEPPQSPAMPSFKAQPAKKWLFIQVLASSDETKVNKTAAQLSQLLDQPTRTSENSGVYKLRVGPLISREQGTALIKTLKNNGYLDAYMLYSPD